MDYLGCDFFERPVQEVAVDLVGRTITVRSGEVNCDALIVETEAYGGPEDPASHAAFKPKGGARLMWGHPGTIYVYKAYGMYPCLNIVCESEGTPGAVLLRGAKLEALDTPTMGPGRLGRALDVTLEDNGLLACGSKFSISATRQELEIDVTPRIGITRGMDVPWRFIATLE